MLVHKHVIDNGIMVATPESYVLRLHDVFANDPDVLVIEKERNCVIIKTQCCVMPMSWPKYSGVYFCPLQKSPAGGNHEMAGFKILIDAQTNTRKARVSLVEDDVQVGLRFQPKVEFKVLDVQPVSVKYLLESMPCPKIQMTFRKGLGPKKEGA